MWFGALVCHIKLEVDLSQFYAEFPQLMILIAGLYQE
jgi:hypothetical protein